MSSASLSDDFFAHWFSFLTTRLISMTQRYAHEVGSVRVKRPSLASGAGGHVDVVVIGGGYAGLHVAIELASRGRKTVVLEASHIGDGASGRNGTCRCCGVDALVLVDAGEQ